MQDSAEQPPGTAGSPREAGPGGGPLPRVTAFCSTPQKAFGLQVPFFFFAAICLVSLVFTGCCVPETKGRSLEQIESFFSSRRRSFLR